MLPKFVRIAVLLCLFPATLSVAQQLSPKWEELTAEDFVKALQSSSGFAFCRLALLRSTDRRAR
jgi:hypothetical protein